MTRILITGSRDWAERVDHPRTGRAVRAIRTEPDDNFSGCAGFQDYPCSLTAGHATRHQDRDGDQW